MKAEVKPLSYYKYETPRIFILWKGHIQPSGRYKTAEDANEQINRMIQAKAEIEDYQIQTPNGILTPVYTP